MNDKIKAALAELDVTNDDHWTAEGVPRLDVVKDLVGVAVSRADITGAAKQFTRTNPSLETEGLGVVPDAVIKQDEERNDTTEGEQASAEQAKDVEPGTDEAVEQELVEAEAALNEAQKRLKNANEAMDVVITRRADLESNLTTAHDIKAYQRSQMQQRQRGADRQRFMAEAMLRAGKEHF